MKKIVLFIIIMVLAIIGYNYATNNLQETNTQNIENPETIKGLSEKDKALIVLSASTDDQNNALITLSNGETKIVGKVVPFEENNFAEVTNYREAFVAPHNQLVAFQAYGFEDAFVQIYDVKSDTLHEKIWGAFSEWRSDGNIEIKSCNLAGEECTLKVSSNPLAPWQAEALDSSQSIKSEGIEQEDFITMIESDPNLSTLATIINVAGQFIRGTGPFTVFAPTNAAFETLPDSELDRLLKSENQKELQELLAKHIVAGNYLMADLKIEPELNTIMNKVLIINKQSMGFTVNEQAELIQTDIRASNGVIHTVDTVLVD